MTDDGARPAPETWAAAYRLLVARLTHELRNPLNGAVVNLEVLRGRSGRAGEPAEALRPFVQSAAAELERAVALVDSLLALARSTPAPVDLGGALRPLVVVLDAIAARAGGRVVLEPTTDVVEAHADGDTARLLFLRATESLLDSGATLRWRVERMEDGACLRLAGVEATPARATSSNDTLVPVAEGDVLIRFPRSGAA